MKLFRLSALVVALSLGACTSSSTAPSLSDPAAPSFDGATFGDGAMGGAAGTTSSDTTSVERGGNGLGSGN